MMVPPKVRAGLGDRPLVAPLHFIQSMADTIV
jgi:hypothetical protein